MSEKLHKFDQIAAMRMGVEWIHPISIRGFQVHLRPLSMAETLEVTSNVLEIMSKMRDFERHRMNENTMIAKETLKKASKRFADDKKEPELSDYILEQMTPDEVNYIYKEYVRICEFCNPIIEELSKDQLDDIIDRVKKKDSELTRLSTLELINLARYLVTKSD